MRRASGTSNAPTQSASYVPSPTISPPQDGVKCRHPAAVPRALQAPGRSMLRLDREHCCNCVIDRDRRADLLHGRHRSTARQFISTRLCARRTRAPPATATPPTRGRRTCLRSGKGASHQAARPPGPRRTGATAAATLAMTPSMTRARPDPGRPAEWRRTPFHRAPAHREARSCPEDVSRKPKPGCRGLEVRCRRRDSNPRHPDHDSSRPWLSHRERPNTRSTLDTAVAVVAGLPTERRGP
jgi:hypothetical protein